MPKLPLPPPADKLACLTPVIHMLPQGSTVTRLFFAKGPYPTTWDEFRFFGPTASRFDHHVLDEKGRPFLQDRGILYLAYGHQAIPTCLAEAFQTSRIIDRYSRDPILCGFQTACTLKLLDLTGVFVTALGASTALHSGPRPRARQWSQHLYLAYPEIDGLLYCSSMYGNHPVIALFERGQQALPSRPLFHRELNDPIMENLLIQTGAKIRYQVV